MPQASAKSNIGQSGKTNEPIFTPRFIAGFAVNFILYMQYYALMVAMAGYSAMQFAAGATEGGFTTGWKVLCATGIATMVFLILSIKTSPINKKAKA